MYVYIKLYICICTIQVDYEHIILCSYECTTNELLHKSMYVVP